MQPVHSDARRALYSFPEAKLIIANSDTIIGQHYHRIKTERFILSEGSGKLETSNGNGHRRVEEMEIGRIYIVNPGTWHAFHLKKESVLVGLNTHPFDATDDYRDREE